MEKKFDVEFLPDAVRFMDGLDKKSQEKIYYNIRKAQVTNDPELFKKLTTTIWEFRTLYNQTYYRLFAFWDKTGGRDSVVHMPTKKNKSVSLETMIDKHIGKAGTHTRDAFEHALQLDLLGYAIKEARLYHNLTQEQLGKLIGVQKAQISKLENNFTNARFDTVIKVFNALHAKVNFRVQLPKKKLIVA